MIVEILPTDAVGLEEIRKLFAEYGASLGSENIYYQSFDAELASLPGVYVPPGGGLWLAGEDGESAGCVAMRPLADGAGGELKRLYIRARFRGRRLGRALAETALARARQAGYRKVRLDTLPFMGEAISLYQALGFRPIAPYCYNPVPGAQFLELELETDSPAGRPPAG
jgi:putative acetyltransferase